MAVSYHADVKQARMDAVVDAIDVGTAAQFGKLEIGTTGGFTGTNLLVEMELQKPSFTQTTAGQLDMAMPTTGLTATADETGTAALARIVDHTGKVIVGGLTVTPSSGTGEVRLNSTAISLGQTVTLTQGTITHAA